MGSVEPRFAMTLRRDLWEGIFRANCLHFVRSEAGWVFMKRGSRLGALLG